MASIFDSIRVTTPRRNRFKKDHEVKLSCKAGQLIPFVNQHVVANETVNCSTEALVRFAPLMAPIMHRFNLRTYYFFVPYRLLMEDVETFFTGGKSGTEFPPIVHLSNTGSEDSSDIQSFFGVGSLSDYLGIPTVNDISTTDAELIFQSGIFPDINLLPHLSYNLIMNEYFIDENVDEPLYFDINNTTLNLADCTRNFKIFNKRWPKDYFTSALPWTQRGEEVKLPMDPQNVVLDKPSLAIKHQKLYDRVSGLSSDLSHESLSQGFESVGFDSRDGLTGNSLDIDPNGTLKTDGSTSITINKLRTAIKMQEALELTARCGYRFKEYLIGRFGVCPPDSRLQRPEFLGGGNTPVVISEVLQTSQSTEGADGSNQGNMAGHAVSVSSQHSFKYHALEPGIVLGILCVFPTATYQQGLNKFWTKKDRFDFYDPLFAHLGEQEVLSTELDFWHTLNTYQDVSMLFGYQSRFAEYKTIQSSVHGAFRDSLQFWHAGRIFDNAPALNSDFLKIDSSDFKQIFNVNDQDVENIYLHLYVSYESKSPMPKFGTPYI